jgi:hypothetical protein
MNLALSNSYGLTKKRMAGLLMLGLLTVAASAQWLPIDTGIPAFHSAPPKGSLPPLLPEDQRTGIYFTRHYQTVAYQMAAAVPTVIYQQPCFCWCSRAMGHKSLYSCFQDSHGATCTVCMSEAAFAYQQTRLGKTPAEIRAAIIKGDWKAMTLPGLSLESPAPSS